MGLKIFGYLGIPETVHLIDHPNGRVNDGIGTDGAGAFAEPQAQAEQGTGMQVIQEELVPRFVALVPENAVFEHFRIKA